MLAKDILKIGDANADVLIMQAALINLGIQTVWVDGEIKAFKADGKFGKITQEAVSSFQAHAFDAILAKNLIPQIESIEQITGLDINLEVTGKADYPTYWAITNYDRLKEFYKLSEIEKPKEPEEPEEPEEPAIDYVAELTKIYRAEIGVTESGGNNYGKRVQEYQKIGSKGIIDGGSAWCQFFMNFGLVQFCKRTGLSYKWTYSGYTPTWVNWGKAQKIATIHPKAADIKPGMFGYVYSAARDNAQHVYFITAVKKNSVLTIEGNTNSAGGSDGQGVWARERSLGNQCFAVLDILKLIKGDNV